MKHLTKYLLFLLPCLFWACGNDDTVDFAFSPTTPRAGEKVIFTNLTDEGEKWAWNFGDEGTGSAKSPTKIYKQPGTYTVTLTVDEKKYRTRTREITVLDTVPTLVCSADTLSYFETAAFEVSFYNPNDEDVTYAWSFPENMKILKGDSASAKVHAYCTEKDVKVQVSVVLTMGEKCDTLTKSFYVKDTPAVALILATAEGNIFRQRMYDNGLEAPSALNSHPATLNSLLINQDNIYLLGTDILKVSLRDNTAIAMIEAANAKSGYLNSQQLYWTDGAAIHSTHILTKFDKIIATKAQLIGFPHTAITALANYTSLYLVTGDKGIYRFQSEDVDSGKAPVNAPILSQYAITHMAVDAIARKIYFIASGALYVSNIDGTYDAKLAEQAAALTLDNASNRVYYATAEGICYLPLVQTQNNTTTAKPYRMNDTQGVVAIAVDTTKR